MDALHAGSSGRCREPGIDRHRPQAPQGTDNRNPTLLGLVCMEAEYWVAHGFPASEVWFFSVAVTVSLVALFAGTWGCLLLSVAGFAFFTYVNLRYGAPYLLDYIMPGLYASLMAYSRRALSWSGRGILAIGRLEGALLIAVLALMLQRTTTLAKWGWISGKPW